MQILKKILLKEKKKIILYMFVIFAFISVLFIAVSYVIEINANEISKKEIVTNEERLVDAERIIIENKVDRLVADVLFISDTLKYCNNLDDECLQIENQWIDFSNRKKIYDQIRYIDVNGNEKIRVNYSDGVAYLTEQEELQNKEDRYYFQDTIDLDNNTVYISKLDLNVENNEIETPIKPMIRFSTPVFDEDGNVQGIVILNYLADDMLTQIDKISETSQGNIFMCNENGYWLYNSVDATKEWAFMYEGMEDVIFENEFPEEWDRIATEKQGSFITENGAFSFVNALLQEETVLIESQEKIVLGEGDWYVISTILPLDIENEVLFQGNIEVVIQVIKSNAFIFALLLFLSFIIALFTIMNKIEQDEIKYFSEYDVMTGVYNRRAGYDKLKQIYSRSTDNRCEISICFIDINGLKEVNDNIGHEAGDELILSVIAGIKKNIRENDFVARFGGDEFLIIFEKLSGKDAELIWTRIVNEYEKINNTENRKYLISVSHGIETFACETNEAIDATINSADEKMYAEKRIIKAKLSVIRK